jgi:cytochrome c
MHRISRRRSPSRFTPSRRRALTGAALAAVIALALGGSAVAEFIDPTSPPAEGNKRYYQTITAKHSGLNLNVSGASTANGAEIGQWYAPNHMNEQWEQLYNGSKGYMFRNRWSRQCITSPNNVEGAVIVQRPCEGTPNQLWMPEQPAGGGTFWYLRNLTNKFDLNIAGGSGEMGAKLIQYRHVNAAPNAEFDMVGHYVTD